MKVKTSVTLSAEILHAMDQLVGQYGNRSALVEHALRAFLTAEAQRLRDTQDLDILNRCADRLNAEAQDVLGYQVEA